MALINLRNALMAGRRLPYDAEVEYLESTGTQWIEIGMTLDLRCVLDMTFQFTQFVNAATCHGQTSTTGSIPARFAFGKGAASWNDWYCGIGDKNYRTGTALDTAVHRFVVDAPGDKFVIDNTTYNVGRTSFDLPPRPNSAMLYNRARVDSSTLDDSGIYGKLYCCKIWQDGTLVRDFIPVRKGTVGYLYDRVSGALFGNAGTGDFVLGPDVVPVEYLQGDGNAYIDTPIVFNSGTDTVEADFELLVGTVYKWCFGSHDTATRCAVGSGDGTNRRNVAYGNGTTQVADSYFLNNRCSFRADVTGVYLNDAKIRNSQNFSATTPMRLFGLHVPNDNGTYASQTRLWSFAVTRSGTSIATYKPVRVGSEGAMMDVLTRRIYRNAGTGAFTYGNDLKYPIPAE